jgi:hypothetical protein
MNTWTISASDGVDVLKSIAAGNLSTITELIR